VKIKTLKSGAYITQDEPSFPTGMITVTLKAANGSTLDRVRCDAKSQARDYFKLFSKTAKERK
jgi:hypothetical protein